MALSPPLSREDVLNFYRYVLGRKPENEDVVKQALLHHSSFQQLRTAFLESSEFRNQLRVQEFDSSEPTYISRLRPAVVFIHLLKTGGTSLHALLEQHFPRDRIFPVHDNRLDLYAARELNQFEFFSGHFDWFSVGLIPRQQTKRIAMFRDPQARLISFYRFIKSHPPGWEHENNLFVTLVHSLSAEEFFEHPFVRSSPEICNHYLLVFGLAYAQVNIAWAPGQQVVGQEALAQAVDRVRSLDGIGITERFNESLDMIFPSLGLPVPGLVPKLQVTENLNSAIEPVVITPRLAEAFKGLTVYDEFIYREAVDEFERRRTLHH
jgi:hypothetical protein